MKKTAMRNGAVASVAAAALLLAGCGGDSEGGGDTLQVTLSNHPWTTIVQDRIGEFEEASGYDVSLEVLGEDQLSDQYNVRLNSGTSDIDVMMMRPLQEGSLFSSNGWMLALDEYLDSEELQWDDFQMQDSVTTTEGVVGIPIVTEQQILYYRTDLLEDAGLEVPATFEELEAAAAQIQEENEDVVGFVSRGQRSAAVTQFSTYLFNFGGDFDDGAGNATLDTAEAAEAYEFYGRMLDEYGPPGVTNMSWPEASAIFQQGQAAFYTDGSVFYNNILDESQSRVGEDVGFAQMPAGPAGSLPWSVPTWALGINQASQNPDGAWAFIEWATGVEMTTEIQAEGVAGARNSVWDDPAGTSGFPDQLAEALVSSAADGVGHDRPVVVEVGRARDIVGAPLIAYLEGEDLEAALAQAQQEYQDLLDEEAERY